MPAFSELLSPAAKSGLSTSVISSPASAARTSVARFPVTNSTGRAPLPSAASATRRTIVLPPTSANSLLSAPMRVERPAARTMAATRAVAFTRGTQPEKNTFRKRLRSDVR